MDRAKRVELLRKAFKAAGGIPYLKEDRAGEERTKPIANKGPGKPLAIHFGITGAEKRPFWLERHTALPDKRLSPMRREKSANPLMIIAASYPVRLPRKIRAFM